MWTGPEYHFFRKNCCHFAEEFAWLLVNCSPSADFEKSSCTAMTPDKYDDAWLNQQVASRPRSIWRSNIAIPYWIYRLAEWGYNIGFTFYMLFAMIWWFLNLRMVRRVLRLLWQGCQMAIRLFATTMLYPIARCSKYSLQVLIGKVQKDRSVLWGQSFLAVSCTG